MISPYNQLLRMLKCGKLACMKDCCNILPEVFDLVSQLSSTDRELFYLQLCEECANVSPAPSPGGSTTPAPQPGGGSVGPEMPANPIAALIKCAQSLAGTLCDPDRLAELRLLRASLAPVLLLAPAGTPQGQLAKQVDELAGVIDSFCTNTSGDFESAQGREAVLKFFAALCKTWGAVAPSLNDPNIVKLLQALPDVWKRLTALGLNPPDGAVISLITNCCKAYLSFITTEATAQPGAGVALSGSLPGYGSGPGYYPGAVQVAVPVRTADGRLARALVRR